MALAFQMRDGSTVRLEEPTRDERAAAELERRREIYLAVDSIRACRCEPLWWCQECKARLERIFVAAGMRLR